MGRCSFAANAVFSPILNTCALCAAVARWSPLCSCGGCVCSYSRLPERFTNADGGGQHRCVLPARALRSLCSLCRALLIASGNASVLVQADALEPAGKQSTHITGSARLIPILAWASPGAALGPPQHTACPERHGEAARRGAAGRFELPLHPQRARGGACVRALLLAGTVCASAQGMCADWLSAWPAGPSRSSCSWWSRPTGSTRCAWPRMSPLKAESWQR